MSNSVRSLESEATGAFKSPSQLVAKRLGNRCRSPRSSSPSGASVGGQSRRSVSMIRTEQDEEIFNQIGGATAVTVSSPKLQKNKAEHTRSHVMDLFQGKMTLDDVLQGANMEDLLQGANAAAEILMRSISPATCPREDVPHEEEAQNHERGLWNVMSHGNQEVSSSQRTPLDLYHNDNSFHVLATLLVDFLQTKLTPDGHTIILQPEDKVRMERVLPDILRLDFIDAVVHRLKRTPKDARTPLHFLTLQCHEFGIDREGFKNPILAAANLEDEPAFIPVQSFLKDGTDDINVMVNDQEQENGIPFDESPNPAGLDIEHVEKEEVEIETTETKCRTGLLFSCIGEAEQSTSSNPREEDPSSIRCASPDQETPEDSCIGVSHDSNRETRLPGLNNDVAPPLPPPISAMQSEDETPTAVTSGSGGFFQSLNPCSGLTFPESCPGELTATSSSNKEDEITLAVPNTFSNDILASPERTIQHGREPTLEETKTLAKEQLYAEIREAENLIAHSKNPETVKLWEEHVAELNERILVIDGNKAAASTSQGEQEQAATSQLETNIREVPTSFLPTNGKSVSRQDGWKDAPTYDGYDMPMVDVVAPADLPGGYNFEAELEGKRFLATVPAGGVKQGETFTCYMRELDSVAIDIPVGYWKDNLTDVCAYGCYHPVFWNPIICPLTSLWQIQTRVGLDFMGRPREEGVPSPQLPNRTVLLVILSSWVFMNGALLAGYNFKWSRGLDLSLADISAIGLVNLVMFAFVVFVAQSTRNSVREKFLIRENRCSDLEDIYVSALALPCAISQMSRHTANYDDYEAVCCSKTGLPDGVRVNQRPTEYDVSLEQIDSNKATFEYEAPSYPAALV